ncbi:MAG: hypothetical protein ACYS15_05995 [Planctomycetota bacterium]|jgi:hypothetical protein
MAAADLPPEIWIVIALIAGLTVTMCLAVLASLHGYLIKVRKLAEDVRDLRDTYNAAFKAVEFVDGPFGAPPDAAVADDPAKKAA